MTVRIPAEVHAEVDRAAARVDELEAAGLELHFEPAGEDGRPRIELRRLDGTVLRKVSPAEALDIMSSAGPIA